MTESTAVRCDRCATPADPPPVDWTLLRDGSTRRWWCGPCTRAAVRAIEARLDEAGE